jgi:predicted amidohydrolase YtcJ
MRKAVAAGLACLAAAATTSAATVRADSEHHVVADAIYFNGPVETLDDFFSRATALAVKDGRILAVGGNGAVFRHAGVNTRYVNLHGAALLPGFVDAHTHVFNGAEGNGFTLDEAQALALSQGITTLGDLFIGPGFFDELTQFAASGALRIRTTMYLGYSTNCGKIVGTWYLAHPPNRDPNALLRIAGIKIFSDGGSCGVGADTFPFIPPGDPPLGDLWFDQATIDAAVAQADAAGYQVAIHAIGDRGRDEAIAAIDHALAGRVNLLRHRIEHDSIMRPDQIESYARLGIVAAILTEVTCVITAEGFESALPDFARTWFHPLPGMLDGGVPVAWTTDWFNRPIPTLGFHLYNLVTRKQVADDGVTICEPDDFLASGRVTTRQALRIMTLGAAYALHMETAVGSLEPGKLADLMVVSDDPLAVPPDALKDLTILSTVIGGEPVYCVPGSEQLCRVP